MFGSVCVLTAPSSLFIASGQLERRAIRSCSSSLGGVWLSSSVYIQEITQDLLLMAHLGSIPLLFTSQELQTRLIGAGFSTLVASYRLL